MKKSPIPESVRSVERALDLLLALEKTGQPMRLSDLARETGIHKATTQRLLLTLERRGLVEKESQFHYRVGCATLPLANAFLLGNQLSKAALPVLQELAASTEETITLYLRLGFSRVVVQRIEGKHPLRYVVPIGHRLPLHLGAGKPLAATLTEPELKQLLDQVGEIRLVTGAVRTRESFLAELAEIRRQGFAFSINERTLGVVSISAAIPRPDGTPEAVVSLAGLADSVTPERIPPLSVEIRRAAQALAESYPRG